MEQRPNPISPLLQRILASGQRSSPHRQHTSIDLLSATDFDCIPHLAESYRDDALVYFGRFKERARKHGGGLIFLTTA